MSAVASLDSRRNDLTHDLVLPSLLFAGLGAMTWAVRGSAGASAMNAHIAPGLTWGAAWWYVARDPAGRQSRRYASGWVMFALAVGFALAGNRGWMQWPHFFEGHLSTNYARREWVPISRSFGFLWLFVAGAAWAGLPACLLAWCGEGRPLRAWEWTLRIACGLGGAYLAWRLYARFPEFFLPRYGSIEGQYHDFVANPGLARLYRDNGAAVRHAGYCLGFLYFEAARRDWKNVLLISTVGVLNGLGWALCQNWKWAAQVWPDASFNFWRCWECCGGISIGIALGVAYFLANRKEAQEAQVARELRLGNMTPSRQWLLAAGLLLLVGWTQFWPAARDLRVAASQTTSSAAEAWGVICLGAAVACLLAALVYRFVMGKVSEIVAEEHQSLEHWVGIGLMLVLGWFIRNEVTAGFGDGVRQPSWTGLLEPGNIYLSIVVAYCFARLAGRALPTAPHATASNGDFNAEPAGGPSGLDWLATYLCLTVILIAAIGARLVTWWQAPVWIGLVGAAYGIGYYLLTSRQANGGFACDPNLERWGAFVGLLYGLGLSLRKTLKGVGNVYLGDENYWDRVCWNWVALLMLVCLLAGFVWLLHKRLPKNFRGDRFPHASAIIWLVLLAQNVMAQVVTGPVFGPGASWNNFMFNLLYVLLFALTAVVVFHYQFMKSKTTAPGADSCW